VSETQRNFLILGVIAVVVAAVASAQQGAMVVQRILVFLFVAFIAWAFWLARRRNRTSIDNMKLRDSLILHLSATALVLLLFFGQVVYPQWSNGGGTMTLEFWVAVAVTAFGTWWGWNRRVGW
jgi:hypothetical protein